MALLFVLELSDLNPRLKDMSNFATPRKWLSEAVKTNLAVLEKHDWEVCPFPAAQFTSDRAFEVLTWAERTFGRDQVLFAERFSRLFVSSTDQIATLKLMFPEIFVEV